MQYPNFHHHPDDMIFIRQDASNIYVDNKANFLTHIANITNPIAYEDLPGGYDERYYEQGEAGRHYLANRQSSFPQGSTHANSDDIIARYADIKAQQG